MSNTYYHGGPRGIVEMILPPLVTGAKCASDYGGGSVHRRDLVYVTPDRETAIIWAALAPGGGAIYRVEPIGDLETDPDCNQPGLSFQCSKARVVASRKLTKKEVRSIRLALGADMDLPVG